MSIFDILTKKYNKNPQHNMPRCVYGPPDAMNRISKTKELKKKSKHSKVIFQYKEQHLNGEHGDLREFSVIVTKNGVVLREKLLFGFDLNMDAAFEHKDIAHIINNVLKQRSSVINNCKNSMSENPKVKFEIKIKSKTICLDETSYVGEIKETIDAILSEIQTYTKYDIKPKNNRQAEVHGVCDPDKSKGFADEKYNVKPEENVPYEVYGVFFKDDDQ